MTTVIIINYKSEELTIKFVLEELSKIRTEHSVVIVNNAATTDSDAHLMSALDAILVNDIRAEVSPSQVYVISSKENLGFAKGNNLAAEFSVKHFNSEYLLFTNNDIILKDSDVVEMMISKLETLQDVGMLGPNVIGLDGKRQSPEQYQSFLDRYCWMYWCSPFVTKDWKERKYGKYYKQTATEGYHYRVMGSFFICRATDYLKCGMMDPHTFLYAEEMILAERMNVIGKLVYFYPEVTVVHAHGVTTKKNIGKIAINKYKLESDSYYYENYMHTPHWKIIFGTLMFKTYNYLKRLI